MEMVCNRNDLLEAIGEYLEVTDLKEEDNFEKDKLDSFQKLYLLVLIEEFSMKELSIIELFECKTMKEICDLCLI